MPQPTSINVVERREVPSLSLRAAVVPESINLEARTVDVVWATGARVLRGYWDQFYEELSLEPGAVRTGRLNNGAPLLGSHQAWSMRSVIGVVVPGSAKLANGRGTATVRFAKAEDDPDADKIWRKVVDGIAKNVSVGYDVYRYAPDRIEEGSRIPVRAAIDWEPSKFQRYRWVPTIGAGFRSADRPKDICEFETRAPQQERDPMPDLVAHPPAADDAARTAPAADQARTAARERCDQIRVAMRAAVRGGLPQDQGTTFEDEVLRAGVGRQPTDVRGVLRLMKRWRFRLYG